MIRWDRRNNHQRFKCKDCGLLFQWDNKGVKLSNQFSWFKKWVDAIPNLFAYLNDAQIPASSNRLESFFKHLKEKLLLHSGLRLEAKRNFIKWYLHFKNNPN